MNKNYIKEYLMTGTGTEGQLLIPRKIHDTIIAEVDKALIPRSEAALYVPPASVPGSSYDIDLESPNTMSARLTGEGAEFVIDSQDFSSLNVKPKKYGTALRITKEMIEDSKFELLNRQIRKAGKKLAENENSLIISDALDNATNTVTGGAAITIANITRAMQYLEDSDYNPTTFAVGMEVLNDLRNIDTFTEYNKVGNREMLERGFLGTIYGMLVLKVSTNAGMTTTSSFVFDRDEAYAIVEKRTITIENFDLPCYDMSGATVSQRIGVRYMRAGAIAKITTT